MDTESKIACCQICLLADGMKTCPRCAFNAGLVVKLLKVADATPNLPPAKMIIGKTFAERWTTNPAHYREHFKNYHGFIEVQS